MRMALRTAVSHQILNNLEKEIFICVKPEFWGPGELKLFFN